MHWIWYLLGVYLAICYGWGMYVLLRLMLRGRLSRWRRRVRRAAQTSSAPSPRVARVIDV